MKNQILWYLFAIAILLSSCLSTESVDQTHRLNFDISNHQEQQRLFQENQPEKYSYIYYSSGFFYQHYRVYVSDNKVDSVLELGKYGSDSAKTEHVQHYHIDSVFEDISNTYVHNNEIETAEKDFYITGINCEYDSEWHFPSSYSLEYYQSPNIEVDGNFGAQISDFRVEE